MAGIILAMMNMILITVCIVCWLKTDRTKPRMEFQALAVVYREGMDNTKLLEGVTAVDNEDGDVTDRVVIEKIVEDRQKNEAVVFYAASDAAGNVAKASRVFPAVYGESGSGDGDMEQFLNAGIDADLSTDGEAAGEKEDAGVGGPDAPEGSMPSETPGNAGRQSPEGTAGQSPLPSETPKEEPTAPKTPEPAPVKTPEPASDSKPAVDPSVPVLSLKVSEVKVPAGQGPAWVDIIGTLSDDKDNYETLFKNLSVTKYDKDKAGAYQVTVSTEDSDGNRSQAVPLTIVVK